MSNLSFTAPKAFLELEDSGELDDLGSAAELQQVWVAIHTAIGMSGGVPVTDSGERKSDREFSVGHAIDGDSLYDVAFKVFGLPPHFVCAALPHIEYAGFVALLETEAGAPLVAPTLPVSESPSVRARFRREGRAIIRQSAEWRARNPMQFS